MTVPVVAVPIDLGEIQQALSALTETATKSEDVNLMLAVTSLQLSLSIAMDTRRQADELHKTRRQR